MPHLSERLRATLDTLRAEGTYKVLRYVAAPMGPTTPT